MNKRSKAVAVALFFVVLFAYLGCFGLAGVVAEANAQTEITKEEEEKAKAEAKLKMKLEKKAREAEKLREKKEEQERREREKAELEREKAKARAKAKAEAQRLAEIDAGAKAQAKAEIAQAKEEMEAALAKLKEEYPEMSSHPQQKAMYNQRRTKIKADYEEEVAKAKAKMNRTRSLARLEQIELPEDNTPKLSVRRVRLNGNILVGTDEVIRKMPLVYNASDMPLEQADPMELYDFRELSDVILEPGKVRQISARTIQGFTQYILSLYQQHGYAGIYVYVPKSAMKGANQLVDDVLLIEVLEAPVTDVTVTSYDPDQNEKEKGYLRKSAIMEWSPVKQGEVASQKELDDFVNLLNLNPDRYVSAVVTKGAKPNTLAVEYDVYEANPWHYFIQLDNSGTRDRRWTPRIGVINTNLLGVDDTFAAIYQAPWDSQIDDQYSIFGSYDIPIMGPKLRANVYAGYSQYDINPDAGPFNFIGNGHFVGGILRYNALQTEATTPLLGKGWFFDIKGMIEYTRSKVTPSLFPTLLGSNVRFWMWGWGLELHKRDDLSNSSVSFDRWESMKGQSGATAFGAARTNAKSDFSIYDFSARHSQFIDPNKIHRVSGTLRWVGSNERLVPAKMTSFGGMYTVRGYDEYEIVADGGILASVQYEYDLIAADKANMPPQQAEQQQQQEKENPYAVKRLAPLVFFDYGRTTINHPVLGLGEKRHEELCSIGIGALLDIGDHFSGGVYYGYPLIDTPDTRTGKGRVNCSFMLKW